MAFFRNYLNDSASCGVPEEKGLGQSVGEIPSAVGKRTLDENSSARELDINMEVQYQSEGEIDDTVRQPNEAAADIADVTNSNCQPPRRRMASRKWGSTFWSDCQPRDNQGGSDSGKDSRSGNKNMEGSEDNLSDDRNIRLDSEDDDGRKETTKAHRGNIDVPADEMLSDEYYEQDGEDQGDTANYGRFSHSAEQTSRQRSNFGSYTHSGSRNSRVVNNRSYNVEDDDENDNDADEDYEEDEQDGNFSFVYYYHFLFYFSNFVISRMMCCFCCSFFSFFQISS